MKRLLLPLVLFVSALTLLWLADECTGSFEDKVGVILKQVPLSEDYRAKVDGAPQLKQVYQLAVASQGDTLALDTDVRGYYTAKAGQVVTLRQSRGGLTGIAWTSPTILAIKKAPLD